MFCACYPLVNAHALLGERAKLCFLWSFALELSFPVDTFSFLAMSLEPAQYY